MDLPNARHNLALIPRTLRQALGIERSRLRLCFYYFFWARGSIGCRTAK